MENSIYYLAVSFGTALFCIGLILLLKKPFYGLSIRAVKQLDIILNTSLEDNLKDRLIIKNLKKLLFFFSKTIFFILISVLIGFTPVFLYTNIVNPSYTDSSSVYFYISLIIGSCVLFIKKDSSNYSYWSKLMHTIILDNYNIGKFLLKRELNKTNKVEQENNESFVIVTGLARAGTTALTNLLYDADFFHSINYSNMPFLLSPNTWKRAYNPKSSSLKERAHGDNVLFSVNSIEALEEYFFKVILNDSYIHKSFLEVHNIEFKNYLHYLSYQKLFKNTQKETIYLAKNNNFLLRYHSMRVYNKNFKIILIIRNPIEHASSLKRQHENFISQQSIDPFILKYMDWLGHYEFGQNQKVFQLGHQKLWSNYSNDTLNYWIAIWINYYEYVLSFEKDKNLFLISSEDLLNSPERLKKRLSECINVKLPIESEKKFVRRNQIKIDSDLDEELLTIANNIYQKLLLKKLEI